MNSIKDILFGILILMVLIAGYQYWTVWKDALEKAKTAEVQQKQMEVENTILENEVVSLKEKQKELTDQVAKKEQKIADFKAQIVLIEANLKATKNETIVEVDEQKIANNFKIAYSLKSIPTIRVVNVPLPGESWKITSLVMPIDYAKSVINAKDGLVACQAQSKLKDKNDGLNTEIKNLKDEKFVLEEQKSRAYAEGYEKAFTMYKEINGQFIELLRSPPKADLSINWLGILGGIVTGGLVCAI